MRSLLSLMLAISLAVGCGDDGGVEKPRDAESFEGSKPGDCTDLADNDMDGLFDCDDDGCAGSPECDEDDGGDTEEGGTDEGGTDEGGTDEGGTEAGGTEAGGTEAGGTDDTGASDTDDTGESDTDDTGESDTDDTGESEPITDNDEDGVPAAEDCDDEDPTLGALADDSDCDGTLAAADCDDTDPAVPATDADCDGTPTADDCDDADPESTILAEDADCDTVLTADDCDDDNPESTTRSTDADCDTVLTDDDCDDDDPLVFPGAKEIVGDGIDNNCNGIVDGELNETSTECCFDRGPSRGELGLASEHTVAIGDVNDDGVNDFAMLTIAIPVSVPYGSGFRTEIFSGADFPTDGSAIVSPIAYDPDARDFEYRWPEHAMGDLNGDGADEMFLGGIDGGMIVNGADWPAIIAEGTLPSGPHPGTTGNNNVRFAPITTEDGPSVMAAMRPDSGDGGLSRIYTRPGSELDDGGWNNWDNYDLWATFPTTGGPSMCTSGDFDGDGMGDIACHHGYDLKIYFAASRPALDASFADAMGPSDWDTLISGETAGDRWMDNRYSYGRDGVVIEDLDDDGYDDLVTSARYAGAYGNGRAYITAGTQIATGDSFSVGDSGAMIVSGDVGADAVIQVSMGGDTDHDGRRDLWIIGSDHEVDSSAQHARFFSADTLARTGMLEFTDADATWRPPESEYTGSAAAVWVSEPGDLNDDGFDDALLGATGQIWLLTGLDF